MKSALSTLMALPKKAIAFFNSGHSRTVNLKKNIGASFVIKAVAIILSLVKVPILLSYLNPEKYGVWLTIASILEWMAIFDLGLGHGLRNRFAEAVALKDTQRARGLVSTAYLSMSVIMLGVLMLAIPIVLVLDWNSVLNTNLISSSELKQSIVMVAIAFLARFVLQLVSVMLKALQKSALSDLFLPISGIISLALIFLMKSLVQDSLFWACAAIAIPPVVVLLCANLYFFGRHYNRYRPSIAMYHKKYLGDIYSLGWKFFVGQVTALVMFSSANIILSKAVNPEEVTIYNVAQKYFALPISYFMIIVSPYWSAVTDAYYRDEFDWIKANMKKIMQVVLLFGLGLILMLLLSRYAFKFWINDRVHIPLKLSLMLTIYNFGIVFLAPYGMFINGFGKLKLGIWLAVTKTLVYFPVAWYMSKFMGATGLVISLLLVNTLPNILVNVRQFNLIVSKKATGIWNQ